MPLSMNDTPVGSVPLSVNAAAGKPLVVTVKLLASPTVKVVLAALEMLGAPLTVSVNDCAVLDAEAFDAVMVKS